VSDTRTHSLELRVQVCQTELGRWLALYNSGIFRIWQGLSGCQVEEHY